MKQKIKQIPILSQIMKGKLDKNIDFIQLPGHEDANVYTTLLLNKLLPSIAGLRVNYVTQPFFEAIKNNIDSLIENKEVYLSIESASGIAIIHNKVVCYDLKRNSKDYNGTVIVINKLNMAELVGVIDIQLANDTMGASCMIHPYYEQIVSKFEGLENASHNQLKGFVLRQWIDIIIAFHILKKYAKVETKVLEPKSKIKLFTCRYFNDTDQQIEILDSTWFTELVKSEEFKVRGHFRFQAHGTGLTLRKLIWIKDFKKDGYTKRARKELQLTD